LLRKSLEEATTNLQADLENGQWQTEVARCADGFQKFEKWKVEGELLRNRVKWKSVGDQCSKEFFQATREKSTASYITGLVDRFGLVHTSQAVMQQICHEYYRTLYTTRTGLVASEEAKRQALRHVTDKFTGEMKTKLCAPLQLGELQAALKDMKGGKSPGPDGVILEFYKEFWSLIDQEYLEMLLASIQAGRLPPGVTTSMIALLHKGGQRTALTNWRPITLLNLSYKVYAKALQLRLQQVLMETISCEQSAFLLLRFILDNILLTQETMAWAEYSKHDLLFLKLDFSKAYDMVNWDFLFATMEKIGFPAEFTSMIKILFLDAVAYVKVNGTLSSSFNIGRLVRQGCPIASYLFS
jgi:hypothetical protein